MKWFTLEGSGLLLKVRDKAEGLSGVQEVCVRYSLDSGCSIKADFSTPPETRQASLVQKT